MEQHARIREEANTSDRENRSSAKSTWFAQRVIRLVRDVFRHERPSTLDLSSPAMPLARDNAGKMSHVSCNLYSIHSRVHPFAFACRRPADLHHFLARDSIHRSSPPTSLQPCCILFERNAIVAVLLSFRAGRSITLFSFTPFCTTPLPNSRIPEIGRPTRHPQLTTSGGSFDPSFR